MLAAFVGCLGEEPSLDDSSPFHVWRKGDGTDGKLGFFGVRAVETERPGADDDEDTPFFGGEDVKWDGPGVGMESVCASAARVGDGAGPGDRGTFFAGGGVLRLNMLGPLGTALGACASSPTRLRLLLSRLGGSAGPPISFNTRCSGVDRDAPNDGEW